jgi:tRNA-uridine 2-sulfurtransferase
MVKRKNNKKQNKVLLMFSGGLDSRVCAKFLEELGFEVKLFYVNLPFNSIKSDVSGIKRFAQENEFKLKIMDVKKGKLFQEYLSLIRNPKHGVGVCVNPCKDCKIFIFKLAKNYFESSNERFDILASGEVLGQRPMSQVKKALMFDDEKAGLENKILRPLSAKLLPETVYEKQGIVNKTKMFGLIGRRREIQKRLANKYGIDYPSISGGCLLCERNFGNKLIKLFEVKSNKEISYEFISLLKFGRMFVSKSRGLIFSGRNEQENDLIKGINKKLNWNLFFNSKIPGPTIIYENSSDSQLVEDIWRAYSEKDPRKINKFRGILV